MVMEKYEYKTEKIDVESVFGGAVDPAKATDMLNKNGAEGWELISAVAVNAAQGKTVCTMYYFKREI